MKKSIQNFLKSLFVFAISFLLSEKLAAQYSKVTIDATIGTNYALSAVQSMPGIGSTIAAHYTPSRLFSFSADFSAGVLWGAGSTDASLNENENRTNGPVLHSFKFNTEYYCWSGRAYLNIQKLFSASKAPKQAILYLYSGIGSLTAKSHSTGINILEDNVYNQTYYTGYVGLEWRIKGTRRLDYLVTVQNNFTQTKYLDALPFKDNYDNFTTLSFGVSYSLCPDKQSRFIDWSRARREICQQSRY